MEYVQEKVMTGVAIKDVEQLSTCFNLMIASSELQRIKNIKETTSRRLRFHDRSFLKAKDFDISHAIQNDGKGTISIADKHIIP